MIKFKEGDKVYSSFEPYTGQYTYKGKSYLNCNYALVVDESGQEFQFGYDDLALVAVVKAMNTKSFNVGDKVKIQQDMWEKHQATLQRLGFSAPSNFDGYEVSQVFANQQRISLKGCYNIYNSEYFELCLEQQSTEMAFKPESNTPQDIQGIHTSALDKQVSGNHYKDCGIQPIEYIHANGLNYFEGNAVKYITRHRKKNGKADIEKAIHYLELMIELEYPK